MSGAWCGVGFCIFLLVSVTVGAEPDSAAAAKQDKVDFQRDVAPILQQQCVACHGPEMQMAGFRLDRRADAMRGGTQTNIGPRNADGSRLYHRVAGASFGQRMPPGAPLTDRQIEIVRQWIDEGAHWPDEASGEKAGADDPAAVQLMTGASHGDSAFVKRLREAGCWMLALGIETESEETRKDMMKRLEGQKIRAALAKVGYDGWLVAEMEDRYHYALDQQFYDTSAALDRIISAKF